MEEIDVLKEANKIHKIVRESGACKKPCLACIEDGMNKGIELERKRIIRGLFKEAARCKKLGSKTAAATLTVEAWKLKGRWKE